MVNTTSTSTSNTPPPTTNISVNKPLATKQNKSSKNKYRKRLKIKQWNNIRIASINIQGKYVKNKSDIEFLIEEEEIDVLCIQDTGTRMLYDPVREQNLKVRNHTHETYFMSTDKPHFDRENESSLITIVNRQLVNNETKVTCHPSERRMTIKLLINDKNITIYNVYFSPLAEIKNKQVDKLKKTMVKENINIVVGDLNDYPNQNKDRWSNNQRVTNHHSSKIYEVFEEKLMIDTFRLLHPDKEKFSRFGYYVNERKESVTIMTRIDQIWISEEILEKLTYADIIEDEILIADHRIIVADLKLCKIAKTVHFDKTILIKPDFSKVDDKIISKLNSELMNISLDSDMNKLNEEITEIIRLNTPIQEEKKTSTKIKYVQKQEIINMKRDKRKLGRILDKIRNKKEISAEEDATIATTAINYDIVTVSDDSDSMIREIQRHINKLITKEVNSMHKEQGLKKWKELKLAAENNIKEAYKKLSNRKRGMGIQAVLSEDTIYREKETVKSRVKAEWAKQFTMSMKPSETPEWLDQNMNKLPDEDNSITKEFNAEEIKMKMSKLKNDKAAGPDKIYNEMLKKISMDGLKPIQTLFNKCLSEKQIPSIWKHSTIYPIFKGTGSDTDMTNYRPIALLSNLYKVFTNILNQRLNNIIEKHNILSDAQFGFRKNRDTTMCINILNEIIGNRNEKGKNLHLMYIDLSKAYDSVQQWTLSDTLQTFNLSEQSIDLICNMNNNNTADVITAFGNSDKFVIEKGVRQGDPMSPLLFNLVTTALIKYIEKKYNGYRIADTQVKILAFADDMVLISESYEELEKMKEDLEKFCSYNKMCINAKKSAHAYIDDKDVNYDLKIGTTSVEQLKDSGCYKYLGVQTNLKLQTSKQYEDVSKKYMNTVRMICNKTWLNWQMKIKAINLIAIPILAYSMQIIDMNKEKLEELQQWTTVRISQSIGIRTNADSMSCISGLDNLINVNKGRRIATSIDRVLNQENMVSVVTKNPKYIQWLKNELKTYEMEVVNTSRTIKVDPFLNIKENSSQMNNKTVYIDASFKKNVRGNIAVWYSPNNSENTVLATNKMNIQALEVLALELAISKAKPNDKIQIVTDSVQVKTKFDKWNKESLTKRKHDSSYPTWNRIMNKVKGKNIKCSIEHLNAHKKKEQKNRNVWKNRYLEVSEGNKQADKLAKSKARNKIELTNSQEGTDKYVLIQKKNLWSGNINKHVKNANRERDKVKWLKKTTGTIAMMLTDKSIDQRDSLWPLLTKEQLKQHIVAKFRLKSLNGLPTKHVMFDRLAGNSIKASKQQINKWKKVYSNDKCNSCGELENTTHVFNCIKVVEYNNATIDKYWSEIKKIVNITKIPWWFSNSHESNRSSENQTEINKLGNCGMIPNYVKLFAKRYGKAKKKLYQVLINIAAEVPFNIWKNRCENLYK